MTETVKNPSFTLKEITAITLSIAAFILSIINFYFTNYRIDDNLAARAIGMEKKTYDEYNESVFVKVIFTNAGNRQGLILAPIFQVSDTSNPRKGTWLNTVRIRNENIFPMILQPHEMKIVDLELLTDDVLRRPGKISADSLNTYKLGIIYFSMDSEAKQYIVWSDFNICLTSQFQRLSAYGIDEYLNKVHQTNLFED